MHPFRRFRRSYRVAYCLCLSVACGALAGCVSDNTVASRTNAAHDVAAVPAYEPVATAAAMKHPVARATSSVVRKDVSYSAVGLASWYGADFHGRRTADGETFNMHSLTAAHRTLPLDCTVRVTNLANHRSLLVRVNDRGPYVGNRLIDLSAQSAKLLGFYNRGVAKVKVDYVGPASRPTAPGVTASAGPL